VSCIHIYFDFKVTVLFLARFATIHVVHLISREPGYLSIVYGYGLDDRAIEVRSPAGTIAAGVPFSGAKARPGRDADHSPHLVPRS
jgi:hypothetical protein